MRELPNEIKGELGKMATLRLETDKNKKPICIMRPWPGGDFAVYLATPAKVPEREYHHFLLDLQDTAGRLERLGLHPLPHGKDSFLFDIEKYSPWS